MIYDMEGINDIEYAFDADYAIGISDISQNEHSTVSRMGFDLMGFAFGAVVGAALADKPDYQDTIRQDGLAPVFGGMAGAFAFDIIYTETVKKGKEESQEQE